VLSVHTTIAPLDVAQNSFEPPLLIAVVRSDLSIRGIVIDIRRILLLGILSRYFEALQVSSVPSYRALIRAW
jgi:hypothetical protein